MSKIQISTASLRETGETVLILRSPFHPDCANRARLIGGRWHAGQKHWRFDPRDEALVRKMAMDLWGDDGTPQDRVTVLLRARAKIEAERELFFAGQSVVSAHPRGRINLAPHIRAIDGPPPESHGRGANFFAVLPEGCQLKAVDLPLIAVQREMEAYRTCPHCEGSGRRMVHCHALSDQWCDQCRETKGRREAPCDECHATGLGPLEIVIDYDAPSEEDVAARAGAGIAASDLERAWAAVSALPEQDQMEIRNRLLML